MDFANGGYEFQVYTMDEKSNDSNQQKRSVKSYARSVFQESTIGIVGSIASSNSNARRLFKSLVLIMCVSGFSYQCITFLIYVFQYPTSVDIDIQKPKSFNSPAFTFCNNNGIRRSVFCEKFPDRCYQPSEKFCSRFHDYCGSNGTTVVPRKMYYDLEDSLTFDEILQLGDDDKSLFLPIKKNMYWNETKGPYMRTTRGEKGAMLCYTLHSVVDTPEYPRQLTRTDNLFTSARMSHKYAAMALTVSSQIAPDHLSPGTVHPVQDEMFIPGNRAGVLFSVHSPYEAVNPFNKGLFLKPGRNYKIFVSMAEEVLLKQPFVTDCVNYEEAWEANNRTGPRIQEMCEEKCLLDAYVACFNCSGPDLLYPSTMRICNSNDYNGTYCPNGTIATLFDCFSSCKDDCRVTTYTPKETERYEVDYEENADLDNYDRYITVEVIVEAGEVVTFKHSPKYMTVEVFSSIGGFIGCWLGISLMDIIDVLASVFSVCRYSFIKSRKK